MQIPKDLSDSGWILNLTNAELIVFKGTDCTGDVVNQIRRGHEHDDP